jgi:hypothetical protein
MDKRYQRGNKKESSLVSFGHCVVCPSSTYSFLLLLWYLLSFVLSVLLRLTPSYCLFGIFWSLCCMSFFDLLLLIAPLVSFGHCVVCPSPTYSFLLPLWYLLVILLSVLLLLTPSYSLFWPRDTKEVIRRSKSKKDRQHKGQKIPKRQ